MTPNFPVAGLMLAAPSIAAPGVDMLAIPFSVAIFRWAEGLSIAH
jgi:hypothetical protein